MGRSLVFLLHKAVHYIIVDCASLIRNLFDLKFSSVSLLRCSLHLEAAGPVSGVWLLALVPGSTREIHEGDECCGERTEYSGHQPRWETHADYELDSEEARRLSAGVPMTAEMCSVHFSQSLCLCVGIKTNISIMAWAGTLAQQVALALYELYVVLLSELSFECSSHVSVDFLWVCWFPYNFPKHVCS